MDRFGAEGWGRFLQYLEPALAKEFSRPVLAASQWYPFAMATCGADALVVLAQDQRILREYAAFNLDYETRMIFRSIFKLGSPEFMVARSDQVWRKFYSLGTMTCDVRPGEACVRLHDFPPATTNFDQLILYSIEAVLIKAGARMKSARHSKCNRFGSPFCEYSFEWAMDPKGTARFHVAVTTMLERALS
jgi:hypothetical protein